MRGGHVQFTEPRGGLEARTIGLGGSFSRSKVETNGGSFSGSFQHGEPKSSMTFKITRNDQQRLTITRSTDDADKAKNSVSVSGSVASSNDYSEYTYTDLNGDGLADRVTKDGYISYNTGTAFYRKSNGLALADCSRATRKISVQAWAIPLMEARLRAGLIIPTPLHRAAPSF